MLVPPPLDLAGDADAHTLLRDLSHVDLSTPKRLIAFVDLETTGLDPDHHDIVEIAVIRVDADTLLVLDEGSVLVRPERLDHAEAEALAICGFDEAAHKDALSLSLALALVAPLLEDTLVAGHNVGFDWSFLAAGFRRVGLALPHVDYHRLDTASLAWPLVASRQIRSLSLDAVAGHFGLARPRPHRALADARCSYQVALRLLDQMVLGGRVTGLPEDERELVETLLDRLDEGRERRGRRLDDGCANVHELLDGLGDLVTARVRRRPQARRRRRVYVCHPTAADLPSAIERVRAISQALIADGILPIAPHLYLPQLVDEAIDREHALSLGLELLATCDEVRVFGHLVTESMERELRAAKRLGIPVHVVGAVRS